MGMPVDPLNEDERNNLNELLALLYPADAPIMIVPDDARTRAICKENGFQCYKEWPDGRCTTLKVQMFNTMITIGTIGCGWWDDAWEFEQPIMAVIEWSLWEPKSGATGPNNEPDGWIRNPPKFRRRPNGDPTQEYLHP